MLFYPNYYPSFACIADKCRHNCCIGWEIDIDEDTLAYYDALGGAFGTRLANSILREDGCACFALDEKERCPFLNDKNLCDIIASLGEDALCDICTDHPRFRHFFTDRTELGLGLTCEAASVLILGMREKMTLVEDINSDGGSEAPTEQEKRFYAQRERLFEIAQRRELPLDVRMKALLSEVGGGDAGKSFAEWADLYENLERMDSSFDAVILRMRSLADSSFDACDEILFEQLLVYFLYRHLTPNTVTAASSFAVHATRLLRALAACDRLSFEETAELCRLYSSEIEYSEENTVALLALFRRG